MARLFDHSESDVIAVALQCVGNIAAGTDAQTDSVLAAGVLNHMKRLLSHISSNIVYKATRLISNITAGTSCQIQAVIDAGIFEHVRNVLVHGEMRAKKEAAFAIVNTSRNATPAHIDYLLRHDILKAVCNSSLIENNTEVGAVILNGLVRFFKLAGHELFTDNISREDTTTDLLEKLNQLYLNWAYVESSVNYKTNTLSHSPQYITFQVLV